PSDTRRARASSYPPRKRISLYPSAAASGVPRWPGLHGPEDGAYTEFGKGRAPVESGRQPAGRGRTHVRHHGLPGAHSDDLMVFRPFRLSTRGPRLRSEEPCVPLRAEPLVTLAWADSRYPAWLRVVPDPPPVLWIRGDLSAFEQLS